MKIQQYFLGAIVLFPVNALGVELPRDPSRFTNLENRYEFSRSGDYCYMDTAYTVIKNETDIVSISLLWNHDANRPLNCTEYSDYVANKKAQYEKALAEYRKVHPAKEFPRIKK